MCNFSYNIRTNKIVCKKEHVMSMICIMCSVFFEHSLIIKKKVIHESTVNHIFERKFNKPRNLQYSEYDY